ncbi:MAG: tol-pal system protein YbgF, partial [Nitrospirota bacterium]
RESQTAMYSQVLEISKELQMLRGRFDENKFHIDKALKESNSERELFRSQINSIENRLREINNNMEARLKELNERVIKLSSTQTPPAVQKPPTSEVQEGTEKPLKEQPAKDEQQKAEDKQQKAEDKNGADDHIKVYESAYNLYKEKRYSEAREKFIAFIRKYPKERLADRAQFWVAETLYSEKDYEGSILAYETLIKAYPKSEKAQEALFKQGMAFIELGDKKTAKILFEKLIDKYPESKDVPAAKKKLSEMNANIKKKK